MRYAAFAYIIGDLLVRARSGYLRRRPYWTSASSRRFLIACAFPIAALVFTFWVTLASGRESGAARSARLVHS
jgi:hypothetical protein